MMLLNYVSIFLVSLICLWLWTTMKKSKKLPPGPKGLPILGSLLKLGANPHLDLHKLSQKYGPIMHLRLGLVPTIVVSTPHAAELFLKTHDLVFASRPPTEATKYMAWEQRNLSFSEYGSYWRDMRKMCTLELLSTAKMNAFRAMREEEVDLLIKSIRELANDGKQVDISAKIATLTANMSCRMVLGKTYSDNDLYKDSNEKGFTALVQEGIHLAAAPNIGDYIPYAGIIDLQGITKRMKAISKIFDDLFERIIDEHIQFGNKDEKSKDFVDVMLGFLGTQESEYRIERTHVKALILDMLVGSMDTSATGMEWTISELIKNPRIMKKVQKELEDVVGMKRKVEESDLEKLEYLNMVIKESLRLHPVAPFLIPHQSTEDCMVEDFFIPKNSKIIVNTWSIMRDPNAWNDPEKFWPERFEGTNIDVKGHDFQLLPFGAGRRGCPGLQLGMTKIRLAVAQLVHCFDWKLPNNMLPSELDMEEEFGLAMPRAHHLIAIPSYRLDNDC